VNVESAGEVPISRSEFARRRNVSPARVTQWVDGGKIGKGALAGDKGKGCKLYESVAVADLRRRLDVDQVAGNGIDTNLTLSAPAAASPPQPSAKPQAPADNFDPVEEQIKRERLEQLQRANRRAAEEEQARAGRLTNAEVAAAQMAKVAASVVTVYEGALPAVATALSAQFNIPQRDALHLLRAEFRKVRVNGAAEVKAAAAALPDVVAFEIEEAAEPEMADT
jgi:hypothetical protein